MINGDVTCTNGSEVDSVCVFQCNEGYEMYGEASLTCESNGDTRWTNNPPSCVGNGIDNITSSLSSNKN